VYYVIGKCNGTSSVTYQYDTKVKTNVFILPWAFKIMVQRISVFSKNMTHKMVRAVA